MEIHGEIITAYGTFSGIRCLPGDKDAPVVLFLHGFPDDSKVWDFQITALKNDYEVWAPDLYQHSFDDQIAGLVSHLKTYGSGRKIVLIGHDMGGPLATEIARTNPHLISKVLLLNSVSLKQFMGRWKNPKQLIMSYYIPIFAGPLHSKLWWKKAGRRFLQAAYDKGGLDKNDPIRNNSWEVLEGIQRYREVARKLSRYALETKERLQTDTYILYGINDPFLLTPDYEELKKHFKSVKLELLPTGHWPQRTCPDEVTKWIKKVIGNG